MVMRRELTPYDNVIALCFLGIPSNMHDNSAAVPPGLLLLRLAVFTQLLRVSSYVNRVVRCLNKSARQCLEGIVQHCGFGPVCSLVALLVR
jgi:hypothetical protein